MGVSLQAKTNRSALLKIISVTDDAIDWKLSYPEEPSLPRKKAEYVKTHDISKLVFLEGMQPSLFVFDHPHRSDISKKIRGLYSAQVTGNREEQVDLFTESFNKAFVGVEEGLDGGEMKEADRRNGQITDAYFQALEDAKVFEELALAFIKASKRETAEDEIHKKK